MESTQRDQDASSISPHQPPYRASNISCDVAGAIEDDDNVQAVKLETVSNVLDKCGMYNVLNLLLHFQRYYATFN